MQRYSFGSTPESVILKALEQQLPGRAYEMKLAGDDAQAVKDVVNQGIDAHLEAITDSTFVWDGQFMACAVGHKDMLVLLRRLGEAEDDVSTSLRSSILSTLDIEEV